MSEQRLTPGQKVQFKLAEIHFPGITEVVSRMTDDVELTGRITLFSDQGEHCSAFAIIEVTGILIPLIVPVSSLTTLLAKPQTPSVHTPEITTGKDLIPAPNKN